MKDRRKTAPDVFTLVHVFNASRERVFNAFGEADALNAWWGPPETRNSVIKLDFRAGGIFHYKMVAREGTRYGRFLFSNIRPHDLLEFSNAFADEHANVVKAPFHIPLPQEIFYRLEFAAGEGKTTLTITGWPIDASPEEAEGFRTIRPSMNEGFGATFRQLATYLDKHISL